MYLLSNLRFSSLRHIWPWSNLAILFLPIGLMLSNTFKLFGFPIFWYWPYLMKVISETRRAHSIGYLLFYFYLTCFIIYLPFIINKQITVLYFFVFHFISNKYTDISFSAYDEFLENKSFIMNFPSQKIGKPNNFKSRHVHLDQTKRHSFLFLKKLKTRYKVHLCVTMCNVEINIFR